MIRRMPIYAHYMAGLPGGINNPLGARALYLYRGNQDTHFRLHGTNEPGTIGTKVSSGCIRLFNHDIIDLYNRAKVGTPVIVLQEGELPAEARAEADGDYDPGAQPIGPLGGPPAEPPGPYAEPPGPYAGLRAPMPDRITRRRRGRRDIDPRGAPARAAAIRITGVAAPPWRALSLVMAETIC